MLYAICYAVPCQDINDKKAMVAGLKQRDVDPEIFLRAHAHVMEVHPTLSRPLSKPLSKSLSRPLSKPLSRPYLGPYLGLIQSPI